MAPSSLTGNTVLLADHLLKHRPTSTPRFRQLVGLDGKVGALTAVCFVLYRARTFDRASVHRLLFQTAPQLVNQLNRTATPKRVLRRGQPQGKIDWPTTFKTRAAEAMDSALFVCLENQRYYSRPENQLLKWVLYQVGRCLDCVPPEINNWYAWGWDRVALQDDEPGLGDYLAPLRYQTRQITLHHALRSVELPRAIEDRHLRAARSSKNQLYSSVAELYDILDAMVLNPVWETWSAVVRETLPRPPEMRDLSELFDAL